MAPNDERAPRPAPGADWPPYAFVPGRGLPHPVRDPAGHLFGVEPAPERLDPTHWAACHGYLRGVDLFNHGYYWEAHEAWEGVWRGHRREETPALFLQGLIKLAAAGVKVREGVPAGVVSLADEAQAHLREVLARGDAGPVYCGLRLADLASAAEGLKASAAGILPDAESGPRVVVDIVLRPAEGEA